MTTHWTAEETTTYIKNSYLGELEAKHNIEILYAVESGSRMWGFESPDSDFDVRFIYRHKDIRDLIAVNKVCDVVEDVRDDILVDAAGWDITKTVGLMHRGNGAVVDWMGSPIVYRAHPVATPLLKMFQYELFSHRKVRIAFLYHHLNLLKSSIKAAHEKQELRGTGYECFLPVKKLLYATRSALLFRYHFDRIERNWVIPDPTMGALLQRYHRLEGGVPARQISQLVEMKSREAEKTVMVEKQSILELLDFLHTATQTSPPLGATYVPTTDSANAVLRALLSV